MSERTFLAAKCRGFAPLVRNEQAVCVLCFRTVPKWLDSWVILFEGETLIFGPVFLQHANTSANVGFERLPRNIEIPYLVVLFGRVAGHSQTFNHCPPTPETPFDVLYIWPSWYHYGQNLDLLDLLIQMPLLWQRV